MAKALRQIQEKSAEIDVVLEMLDARAPLSTQNPVLRELFPHKPRAFLLNKIDLADPTVTAAWMTYFQAQGIPVLSLESTHRASTHRVKALCRSLVGESHRRPDIHLVVCGVPNVGKSSLINTLLGERRAKVENRPSVTRTPAWITLSNGFKLLDTPGILWPKFESHEVALKLGALLAIHANRVPQDEVALFLCAHIRQRYPSVLTTHFRIPAVPETAKEILEAFGRGRGYLVRGGDIDEDRTVSGFLQMFYTGKAGRISLEYPRIP